MQRSSAAIHQRTVPIKLIKTRKTPLKKGCYSGGRGLYGDIFCPGDNPIKYTDPMGLYTDEEIDDFEKSTTEEQMDFLKSEYGSVQSPDSTDTERGAKADEMRDLRSGMRLGGLFALDESFMNEVLRDFLNLNEAGTMNYTMNDLTVNNGWTEMSSFGSQYHQTNAPENGPYNAKFVNSDGREVVVNSNQQTVLDYPDKGTFNYVNGNAFTSIGSGGHKLYDMNPYDRLMNNMGITPILRSYPVWTGSVWRVNSDYWN